MITIAVNVASLLDEKHDYFSNTCMFFVCIITLSLYVGIHADGQTRQDKTDKNTHFVHKSQQLQQGEYMCLHYECTKIKWCKKLWLLAMLHHRVLETIMHQLRDQLISCFEKSKISPFPRSRRLQPKKTTYVNIYSNCPLQKARK